MIHRRQFLHLAAGATLVPAAPRGARAQTYPTRSVHLIVGSAAGGSPDIIARLMGQWLSERLGRTFVIENRSGAAGNIGTEALVHAPADGYTLMLVPPSSAINATLYDRLPFNFLRDVTPVASIARAPNVLEVTPAFPVRTVPELIAYAKANPGKINLGSAGTGTIQHVAGELFKMMAGIDLLHVPYRSGAPAMTDLLAGQVQVMFNTTPTSIEYVRTGRLRALAVSGTTRAAVLPEVPTLAEFIPGYEASSWYGIAAPKHTPAEIVRQAQRRDQCRACGSEDDDAAGRPGRHGLYRLACRFRHIRRRRDREMGQGDQVRGNQAGVIRRVRRFDEAMCTH